MVSNIGIFQMVILCPPIPGRADYIHYIAELLYNEISGLRGADSVRTHKLEKDIGEKIKCLDVGAGANCVYPIIGTKEYGWKFVGTEIDRVAIENISKIINSNTSLNGHVEIRLQKKSNNIFNGIIKPEEYFDITVCNPPFHASKEEAQRGNLRKLKNLKQKKASEPNLNFGGIDAELWYNGGEKQFVLNMIQESKQFAQSCLWFTTLISKESNLKIVTKTLEKAEVLKTIIIPMRQGHKTSRIVAWTFLDDMEQKKWKSKWGEKRLAQFTYQLITCYLYSTN